MNLILGHDPMMGSGGQPGAGAGAAGHGPPPGTI